MRYFVSDTSFAIILMGEERAGCFALFVFLVSRHCCVALPRGATGLSAVCATGLSAVCDCSIFMIILTIFMPSVSLSILRV